MSVACVYMFEADHRHRRQLNEKETKGNYDGTRTNSEGGPLKQIKEYHGDTMVQCSTNHLSTFSIGLFNTELDTDFQYQFITEEREGQLHDMRDNMIEDLYHYVVVLETGYRIFAGTDSKVFISLYGSEADELVRECSTELRSNYASFNWGSSTRFLLKTPWLYSTISLVIDVNP
ncbi:hypothetical protein KIN20_032570 [Parelaphostrongylus tenuis]|uniref:PLAT domain-containing protein n=1 Tax=Parelaphostrongylus tenuis TaxID=148309 RepID=A0AAD5R6T3_PARTN|nr:hypothetical protein KIN20_032570 [Parelaphostrongylus tenuis]